MAEKTKAGIKLFVGHNSDSSHTGRKDVGEVVGSLTRMVSGKLQALAIAVLETADAALDVCSIEADVDFTSPDMAGDVNKITGIALGSSKKDSPAFPGAVRLASLQCFGEVDPEPKPKPLEKGDHKVVPTFEEVKKAIVDMKIFPHQIYSPDELKTDRTVEEIIKQNETLTKDLETSNNKLKELDETGKANERTAGLSDAKARFEKLFPEGITDRTKDYMTKKFDPETLEDLSDTGLKGAFDKLQTQYSEDAKMFGAEEIKEPSGGPSGGESGKGNDDPIDSAVDALMEED